MALTLLSRGHPPLRVEPASDIVGCRRAGVGERETGDLLRDPVRHVGDLERVGGTLVGSLDVVHEHAQRAVGIHRGLENQFDRLAGDRDLRSHRNPVQPLERERLSIARLGEIEAIGERQIEFGQRSRLIGDPLEREPGGHTPDGLVHRDLGAGESPRRHRKDDEKDGHSDSQDRQPSTQCASPHAPTSPPLTCARPLQRRHSRSGPPELDRRSRQRKSSDGRPLLPPDGRHGSGTSGEPLVVDGLVGPVGFQVG